MIGLYANHKDITMSDQETMNRAFAQAVATGTSTVMVSVSRGAGKSTLHRQIRQATTQDWLEPIESRYDITVDEAERLKAAFDESMMDSIKGQYVPQYFKPAKRYTRQEIEAMYPPNPIDLPNDDV